MTRARRRAQAQKRPTLEGRVVRLELGELEIARGDDGFLRGAPEPVLVAGLYVVGEGVALLTRQVVRFARPAEIPTTVIPEGAHELRSERYVAPGERFFGLVCALEEDDGRGVRRAYELLDEPGSLLCFRLDAREPEPVPLAVAASAAATRPVELLASGRPLADEVEGDDLVGAALVGMGRTWTTHRVRFAARGNDWTAIARARM